MPPDRVGALDEQLHAFIANRGWEHFHSPKNLAMAIAAEAGELLAELQWLTPAESEEAGAPGELRDRVADEMADVYIYLLYLSHRLDVSLVDLASDKMDRNERRFHSEAGEK